VIKKSIYISIRKCVFFYDLCVNNFSFICVCSCNSWL